MPIDQQDSKHVPAHKAPVRLMHWVNAVAVGVLLASGLALYNAAPLAAVRFPAFATLGHPLAAALRWHFAAIWLFVLNGSAYMLYGLLTRHFKRRLALPRRAEFIADAKWALWLKLKSRIGEYNALQRVAYSVALDLLLVLLASGLALWKPVQFQELAWIMGGYEGARLAHSVAAGLLAVFLVVHIVLALVRPRALAAMVTGVYRPAKMRAAPAPARAEFPSTEAGDAL